MKVKIHMSPNPIIVTSEISVNQALGLMRKHSIRHLPVVEDGQVKDLVTHNELRSAWFPSLLSELSVKELMATDPLTVNAEETVYQAAHLLHNHKLTGLLVTDHGKLAGTITLSDVLRVLVALLELLNESSRLDVALGPGQNALEAVPAIIRDHDGEVISVALLSSEANRRIYCFRLEKTDPAPIVKALTAAGHKVLG
ncbi:acetoin utilization protein AcuB [Desulfarculales bacterium]